ncbi:hypothetical protein RB215_17475 (plasmid) [Pseudoalteromonas sp. HL-AS2]|uniref:hypothetical protein n=1 Tax=Pseudoalteromonas sp. HL-AS2 TaxID=3071082 RepID=UPI002815FD45|nr:hypothetical protein [Pseudoalteromonas sp. HL-AS2]WMS96192.1 hypothetical protein RB215_17475 [Pseudoalteromonas sp. HL-AS2]
MKKLITLSLCSLLAACGSGSETQVPDSTGDTSTGVVTNVDFVIGTVGPLSDARVCADVNQNLVCEESEFLGLTSASGAFTVSGDYTDTAIIVDAISEKTANVNEGNIVGHSYTMYAEAGSANVSPVTTMAVDSGYSVESIADLWSVDVSVFEGDYTALDDSNAQAVLVGLASDYAIKLLQEGVSLTDVPYDVSLAADTVYAALESGVVASEISFELDESGLLYLKVPSVEVDVVEGDFIQGTTLSSFVGDWSAYHFDRLDGDQYGQVTIKAESSWEQFCIKNAFVDSGQPLNADVDADCYDFSVDIDGSMVLTSQDSHTLIYNLIYGHKSDAGTALLFKVEKIVNGRRYGGGFMWMDDYSAAVNEGMGLRDRDWYHSIYTGLADDSAGEFDGVAYEVDFEERMSVEYDSGEAVDTRFSYVQDLAFSPVFEMNQTSLVYSDGVAYNRTGMLRVDDYIGLALFKRDQKLTLGLLSPNAEIIESVDNWKMYNGTAADLKTLVK